MTLSINDQAKEALVSLNVTPSGLGLHGFKGLSNEYGEALAQEAITFVRSEIGQKIIKALSSISPLLGFHAHGLNGQRNKESMVGLTPAVQIPGTHEVYNLIQNTVSEILIDSTDEEKNNAVKLLIIAVRKSLEETRQAEFSPGIKLATLKKAYEATMRRFNLKKGSEFKRNTSYLAACNFFLKKLGLLNNQDSVTTTEISEVLQASEDFHRSLGDRLEKMHETMKEIYYSLTDEEQAEVGPFIQAKPLTGIPNELDHLTLFEYLAILFKEDKGKHKKTPAEIENTYLAQTILFSALELLKLNQNPLMQSKVNILQKIQAIFAALQGDMPISGTREIYLDNGRQIPEKNARCTIEELNTCDMNGLQVIHLGRESFRVKEDFSILGKIFKNGGAKGLVDILGGQIFLTSTKADWVNPDKSGECAQEMAHMNDFFKRIMEEFGLEEANKKHYHDLEMGECKIESKIEDPQNDKPFFWAHKIYMRLRVGISKKAGVIFPKSNKKAKKAKRHGYITHELPTEFRFSTADSLASGNYETANPIHHGWYKLEQIMDMAKQQIRPGQNPNLHRYITFAEKLINLMKKKEKMRSAQINTQNSAAA